MRKNGRKQGKRKITAPVLATLSEDDRVEYVARMAAVVAKRREMLAAAAHLDAIGEEIRVRYNLPSAYDLDVDTGHITERVAPQEAVEVAG